MEIICVDTDILIDHLRNHKEAVEEVERLETAGFRLSTTVINSFELYYGANKTKKRENNVRSVDKLLERLIILQMTKDASKLAGEIIADLEKEGKIIEFRDALIAGIVVTDNVTFFTRNIEHFGRIKGIKLHKG
jgi:predicted nucleic acid-binding protein